MADRVDVAIGHMRAGAFDQAQAIFEEMLREHPGQPSILNLLSVVLFRRNDVEGARARLLEAVARQPDFSDAWFNLMLADASRGAFFSLIDNGKRFLALRPESIDGVARLGNAAQQAGDLREGGRLLRRAATASGSPGDLLTLASCLHSDGKLDAAIAAYRQGVALQPGNVGAIELLARALLATQQADEARAVLQTAVPYDPNHTGVNRCLQRCDIFSQLSADSERAGLPDGLVVRGSLSGPSGYAHMSRNFVKELDDRGIPLRTVGIFAREPWQPPGAAETDEAMRYFDGPVRARGALNFLIPALVEPIRGLSTVTFSMFEGPRIPDYWVRFCRNHDMVVVPTTSSRDAWVDSGHPADRIRICPLGVDPGADPGARLSMPVMSLDGKRRVDEFAVRILNVSDFIPRKNLDGLLRVWLKATTPEDDTILIIKVGKGKAAHNEEIVERIRHTQRVVGKSLLQAAPIAVLNVKLSDNDMLGLFALATHYWSMSHGEGWDLPLTQAAVMGCGIIAPDHSAYQDYLDDKVAWMIPSRTEMACDPLDGRPWSPFYGLEWWRPDEDAAADIIRTIVRGESRPHSGLAERLRDHFSWRQATDKLIGILRDSGAL